MSAENRIEFHIEKKIDFFISCLFCSFQIPVSLAHARMAEDVLTVCWDMSTAHAHRHTLVNSVKQVFYAVSF